MSSMSSRRPSAFASCVPSDRPSRSTATRFFVYKFDKRSAGLGGLAFEEGEFSVFGYVVNAEEEGFLAQLATGDVIVKAKVVSGLDRLQNGGEEPAAEEPTPGEGEEAA